MRKRGNSGNHYDDLDDEMKTEGNDSVVFLEWAKTEETQTLKETRPTNWLNYHDLVVFFSEPKCWEKRD